MSNKKIYKPAPISGFPEWLPEIRRAEQAWFDHIRRIFESYGFCSIETPSVETLDAINAKGGDGGADVDKEIYVLERLHKEENDKEARLALHFDQTVPLARYTAQHFNDLVFPFKRYQMQRVWRGERPQSGRFREFYQCDIDVINPESLPIHFDAEIPAIIWEVLSSLPGMEQEGIQIRISNRKILMGLLDALNIENKTDITRIVDKIAKITEKQYNDLMREHGVDANNIEKIKSLIQCKNLKSITPENEEMAEGLSELIFVMDNLSHLPEGAAIADLSIVRGLDYYTGTVYETVFLDDPGYGSICSGGRYDDLASNYINKHLPGVGISIGFSRLFERMRSKNKFGNFGPSPADVLVILPSEEQRITASQTAHSLRKNGLNVETFHSPSKLKRQMAYAEKKKIPFVWFPPFDENGVHEVKDMTTGEQIKANPTTWTSQK